MGLAIHLECGWQLFKQGKVYEHTTAMTFLGPARFITEPDMDEILGRFGKALD